MNDLDHLLTHMSKKGEDFNESHCIVQDKEITKNEIQKKRDGLTTSMNEKIEDKYKDYRAILHDEWCDILYTLELQESIKRASTQIKKL